VFACAGGFQGSVDQNGPSLKKKRMMLEEEGVKFINETTVSDVSIYRYES
jgi:hypothetical protein